MCSRRSGVTSRELDRRWRQHRQQRHVQAVPLQGLRPDDDDVRLTARHAVRLFARSATRCSEQGQAAQVMSAALEFWHTTSRVLLALGLLGLGLYALFAPRNKS